MAKKTSYTVKLDENQQKQLLELLTVGNYRPLEVEHTLIAVDGPDCKISLYSSGKCLVQGKGTEEWITYTLEPLITQEARLGYEDVLDPSLSEPHMGIDESGKGDFFGPMVICAAYVDAKVVDVFRELDVKDSKAITSDKKALDLAQKIREVLGQRFDIVSIGPRAYNRLYSKMRNVNKILSWGHARAIENLLEKVPSCPRAVADQFGPKRQIETALMQQGKTIELIQRPKAESDPAVAGASILARAAFITALQNMGEKYGTTIPKGASAQVQEAAKALIGQRGPEILLETAKCHFRTADAVLEALGMERSVLGSEGAAKSKEINRRK